MTLVELLVATRAGMVVMAGVILAMIVTMRETNRVASHVEANQNARIAMTKIINQLHSACVAPQIAPVREDSTSTMLSFLHQSGSAVAPDPVLSKITPHRHHALAVRLSGHRRRSPELDLRETAPPRPSS